LRRAIEKKISGWDRPARLHVGLLPIWKNPMATIEPAAKERLIAIYDRLIELYASEDLPKKAESGDSATRRAEIKRLLAEAEAIRSGRQEESI
jgi:hypothetical protein